MEPITYSASFPFCDRCSTVHVSPDVCPFTVDSYAAGYRAGLEAAAKACGKLDTIENGIRECIDTIRALAEPDSKPPR